MSRPKGSKNKTSNKSKTSNIINKFNARLKSISNELILLGYTYQKD